MKKSVITLFSFVLVCCYTSLTAQNISCNDQVNISLDENCGILDLSVDAFLEGADVDETLYELEILGINNIPIELDNQNDPNYIGNYVGQCLTYNVILISNGNYCWGTVCLEDKILPSVECDCITPYLADGVTPNPDCTFNCYEIWDLEILEDQQRGNNEILPDFPDATDNCGDISPTAVQLVVVPGAVCGEELVTRNLLYQYTDFNGNTQSVSCTQQFLFTGLNINSIGETVNGAWDGYPDIFTANTGNRPLSSLYFPQHTITLSCGAGTEPSEIAAAYDIDTPGRPAGIDRDDHDQTPNIIEHNEGFPYAFPYVVTGGWAGRFHAKPIDNQVCNVYTVWEDLDYDACAQDCFGNSKIARTWTILDWCNADFVNFVQVIKRVDVDGPAISGPNQIVSVDPWGCEAEFTVPAPEHLLDACDKNPTWSYTVPIGVSNNNGVVTLPKGVTPITYVGTDCCGNTTQFTFNVTVADQTAPTVITNENLVIQLTNTQSGDGVAKLYAQDVDNFSHDGCGPVHLEIRRKGGNDWCNPGSNSTFNDDGHPDDQEGDSDNGEYILFCCEDAIDQDSNGVFFGIHEIQLRVWDDGDHDGVFGSAGDNYNESWTTIKVEDKLDPIVVCPPHVELSCNEDYLDYVLTGRPFATKACNDVVCDMDPNDSFRSKPASSPPFAGEAIPAYNPSCRRGAIQRTWSCGGKTCTQWIIMRDTEDGTLTIDWPEDETINCLESSGNEPDVVETLCELTGTSLESDTFYFEDGACYKVLNHWTVINWCDYDADDTDLNDQIDVEDDGVVPGIYTHTQVVKLIDTEKPILSISDTCFAVNANCIGEDLAIWAAASDNGMCASAWLKWDVEVDMYSDWEIDYNYSSFLPSSDEFYVAPTGGTAAMPTAFDETILINNTFQSDAATNGEEQSIEDYLNVAGNTYAQAAIIRDKVEYIEYVNRYDIDLDPECLLFTVVGDGFTPYSTGSVDRYYITFPNGHNISSAVSNNDNAVLRVISNTEIVVEVSGDFDPALGNAFKFVLQSVGESIHISLPNGLPNGCSSKHRVRWTVLDGCGNETSGTSYFTIEDKKKPTPYLLNLSTALMENGSVELWAEDFDTGSFDNCTPQDFLYFTFSPTVPPQLLDPTEEDPWYDADGVASENDYNNGDAEEWDGVLGSSAMVFNQDDLTEQEEKGGLLEIPIYVWDQCGNVDLAVVNLKLVDNGGDASANIAGRVMTQEGTGLPGVTMSAMTDLPGYPYSITTGDNGDYMFPFNPMYNDYMISGAKHDDWLNGVTTLDILLIQKHILDILSLDNEFDLIAADVSNDGNISAVDLIQIRKLILGINSEFPNNVSWKLVNPNMDSETMVVDLDQDQMDQNFTAIKIADVNGSAVLGFAGDAVDSRNLKSLKFNIEESSIGAETVYTFKSENFDDVYGFQFTLEGVEELTNIEASAINLEASNVSLVDGALVVSWNDSKAITATPDQVLFSITVNSDTKLLLSDRIAKSEAYAGENLEILDINVVGNGDFTNELAQNEPNPFKGETVINFSLAQGGITQFTIFDVTGKLVYETTTDYTAGNHSVVLNKSDLRGTSNVLYYKIDCGDFTATKKMIILE